MRFLSSISRGVKILTAVLGLITGTITLVSFFHSNSDTLSMSINDEVLDKGEQRVFYVFMENSHCQSNLYSLYPTFSNSSSWSIKDFDLRYHISNSTVQFIPSDYYTVHRNSDGSITLKYDEDKLTNNRVTENPIQQVVVPENGGVLNLLADASFDGCRKNYTSTITTHYVIVPNEDLTFEDWKNKCCISHKVKNASGVIFIDNKGNFSFSEPVEIAKSRSSSAKANPTETQSFKSHTIHQYSLVQNGVSRNFVDVQLSNIPQGSISIVCLLLKDEDNNSLSVIYASQLVKDRLPIINCSFEKKWNLSSCAICQENKDLRNSVAILKIGKYKRIKNRGNQTIAIWIPLGGDEFSAHLIAPHKSYYTSENCNIEKIKYYDVPENALDYKHKQYIKPTLVDAFFDDALGYAHYFVGFFAMLFIMGLLAPIVELYKEWKTSSFKEFLSSGICYGLKQGTSNLMVSWVCALCCVLLFGVFVIFCYLLNIIPYIVTIL